MLVVELEQDRNGACGHKPIIKNRVPEHVEQAVVR